MVLEEILELDTSYTIRVLGDRPVSSGGFGNVYSGMCYENGLRVAIKVMSGGRGRSEIAVKTRRRFEHEIEMLKLCNRQIEKERRNQKSAHAFHGGFVIPIPRRVSLYYGRGMCKGNLFYVMEWLEPFDPRERKDDVGRCLFVSDLCNTVGWLHQTLGYVHGDIKPSNIMVRPGAGLSDKYVLIDLGSLHKKEEPLKDGECTRRNYKSLSMMSNGDRLCPHTPGYADPLEDRHTIYSDIYSIGQVIRDMFEDVVPLGWGAIINRCLSRYWKYRYQSVFELKDEVDHFTDVNRRARVDFSDEVNKEEFHRQDVEKNFAKSVMCTGRLPTDDECEIPYEIIPGVPPRCLETIRRPVGWDEIIQKEPCPDSAGRQRWTIDMMDEDGGHQKIWAQNVLPIAKQELVLPAGVELEILGPGWLNAEICGRPGSTVILSECVTLHNRVGANKDHAVYVINGGAYLNFCNIKEGSRVAQSVRKRVIQSMTSVSHVRFGGPETLYDLRREVLENSKVLRIPEELRGEVRRCYGFPAKLKSER